MSEDAGGPLSPAELDTFLAEPLLLRLACVRPDGWPYIVPLWFAWSDRRFYVVGRERAAWIPYLRHEPRVGLLIDEAAQPHRRVQMTATATILEGPIPRARGSQRWQELNQLLVARYMADAAGRAYAELTAERPRYLVELRPVQISSWRGGAWHPRYYVADPGGPPPTAVVRSAPT
ncbi:MAG: pyridoxamine 5'-phosphate oxidase family protein [Chloroflexi bacterium]|nr:pyridoxamine 5'-phosphate oxidase family protein [Chloroflexota bacterium]